MGRQRRGEAVRSWGKPPRGTAERVSRLEATVVGSADLKQLAWKPPWC
ncbi:hypothetical protein [Nostoc sp.]